MALSRRRKLLLFLVVPPLVLAVLLVAALFTPAVQTFAARKALAGQGGEVERVSVGLGGASLRGLRIEQPGLRLTVPELRADASLPGLAGGRVELRSLVARDVLVELDPAAMPPAQDPAKPAPADDTQRADKAFDGVLNAELPELRVDGIDLAGRVRVAGPQPVEASFALSGGGIRAGQAGKLELKVEAQAGLGSVVTTFTLTPTLGADGRLDALGAVAEAFATSKLLAQPARLRATAEIARAERGETYALRLLAGETPLVELDTRWAPGATELPGRWKIAVRDEDLAPFALGLILPDFILAGGGELTLLGGDRGRLGGELNFQGEGWETLGLPPLGPLALASKFSLSGGAEEARVESLALELNGTAPVFALETRQPFSADLRTQRITPSRAGVELAEARLLGVPAEWVTHFAPGLSLAGPVTGAWTLRPEGDGFVVVSSQPLVAAGLAYAAEGRALIAFDAVRVEDLRVSRTSAGLEARVGALRVLGGGAELMAAKLEASQKPAAPLLAKGELSAQLARLADQPALRGQTRLSAGLATASFDASLAEALTAGLRLRLTGLRAAGAGDLPELALDATLARDAAGVLTAKAPIVVRNAKANRSSDLVLAALVTPGASGQVIAAKVASEVLFVEDLQLFAALAAETKPAAAPGSAPKAEPAPQPTGPLWAGTSGEVELALARIVYAPGIEVANTKGRLALTKESANLETLQAALGTGGTLDVSGALKWRPETKDYQLGAEVKGDDVAVGPLLKAFKPGEPPVLEGVYDLTATVSGEGAAPAAAAASAAAELKLTGQKGVIRAINLDTNRYARAGSVVSGLAGIAGALSGNEEVVKRANQITALNSVARSLANLVYEDITIEARRAADGSVEIGKLNLLSPQLRLAGGGGLRSVPGRSFLEMPLNLKLELGAKGELAQNLAALRVLTPPPAGAAGAGAAGADAFAVMSEPLVFDGTLQQVGTAQVTRLLTRAIGL